MLLNMKIITSNLYFITFSLCFQTLGGEEHLNLHSCVDLELLNNFHSQLLFSVDSALSNKIESE